MCKTASRYRANMTHTTVKTRFWPGLEPFFRQDSSNPFKLFPLRSQPHGKVLLAPHNRGLSVIEHSNSLPGSMEQLKTFRGISPANPWPKSGFDCPICHIRPGSVRSRKHRLQGCLAHKKHPPPRPIVGLYLGSDVVLGGGGLFLMSEVPL